MMRRSAMVLTAGAYKPPPVGKKPFPQSDKERPTWEQRPVRGLTSDDKVNQKPSVLSPEYYKPYKKVNDRTELEDPMGFGIFNPFYDSWMWKSAPHVTRLIKRLAWKTTNFGNIFMGLRPREEIYRLRRLVSLGGAHPEIRAHVFIPPSTTLMGDVYVERKSNIGYGATIRADPGKKIHIGESNTVGDKVVMRGNVKTDKWVVVEPQALIEDCTIHSCSMIGACSIVLKGSVINSNSMICAGSVVPENSVIPSGTIWSGVPAKCIGILDEFEKKKIIEVAKHGVMIGIEHRESCKITWEEIENQRLGREIWAIWADQMWECRVKSFYVREGPAQSRMDTKITYFNVLHGKYWGNSENQFRGLPNLGTQ